MYTQDDIVPFSATLLINYVFIQIKTVVKLIMTIYRQTRTVYLQLKLTTVLYVTSCAARFHPSLLFKEKTKTARKKTLPSGGKL